MLLLTPQFWKDYELIDSGDFEKMERFGKFILIRPEPQAVWDKKLSKKEWETRADVKFVSKSSSSGNWLKINRLMPDKWLVEYLFSETKKEKISNKALKFKLALTAFKHVGIFPEQAANWEYIVESLSLMKNQHPKVLNLFAYTGGASLAARLAGAEVVHVDSVKQVVSWARENMDLSKLQDIRWVVEDALTFVKREVKRGKKYQGIILDPPAYGHGPQGESWKLENNINEMIKNVVNLLDEKEHFLILNTYSLGFSPLIIENLIFSSIGKNADLQCGELYLESSHNQKLPLGVFGRSRKIQ